jgi:uncharacterized protein YacL
VPPGQAPTSELPGATTFVELIRLAFVILGTGAALEATTAASLDGPQRLAVTALGAGAGYVLGGVAGRFARRRVSTAERGLQRISTAEIVAGAAGALLGLLLAAAVTWPVLLFGAKAITVPLAAVVLTVCAWSGLRIGQHRASDLLVYLGTGGRMPAGGRASGAGYKLVDTSALIDARIVDVCRDGWVEGVLLVPTFVLYELQGLADSEEPDRRRRGQRGLDALAALQRLSSVAVQVLDDDAPGDEVDLKLLHVARSRGTPLLTTDANLARVAEVQGIRVRNLHALADTMRPPVTPGDRLRVRISRTGRERGQGVGYLPDGTMVVVERAADDVGQDVEAEVTSITSTSNGRMLFASRADRPRPVPSDGVG